MRNPRLVSELHRIESHFRTALHEYMHVFTLEAAVEEVRLKGTAKKVPVPGTVKILDRVVTHNHPNETPTLSKEDCLFLLIRGAREIRCYTKTQGGMLLRVPDGVPAVENPHITIKDIRKLWNKPAQKKYGITGPALVARIYGLEIASIPPFKEPK